MLLSLPRKEYLITEPARQRSVWLGLVDLLLGFAYDHRTTYGDATVESAWTIATLASTMSWFEEHGSTRELCVCFVRRALAFPLYRNWKLALRVVADVAAICEAGQACAVRCLLQIKSVFDHDETRYHLSKLYVDDYCSWLQSAAGAERRLGELATQLRSECKQLQMNDTGWPLEQLLAEALGGSSSSSGSDSDSGSSESGGGGKEQKQLITELD